MIKIKENNNTRLRSHSRHFFITLFVMINFYLLLLVGGGGGVLGREREVERERGCLKSTELNKKEEKEGRREGLILEREKKGPQIRYIKAPLEHLYLRNDELLTT